MAGTTFPPLLTPFDFARRLCDLVPTGWASTTAKLPGGATYAVMLMVATQLAFELGEPNSQIVSFGGVATPGDTVSITIDPSLAAAKTFSHVVAAGEVLADVTSALGFLISSSSGLTALGIKASVVESTLTVSYPTIQPGVTFTTDAPAPNLVVISGSVSAGATETIVVGISISPQTGSLQFAAAAMRVQTAIGGALDLSALDFFGTGEPGSFSYGLPRYSGELDAAYQARILDALQSLGQGATRQAVSNAIAKVTGRVPRIVEPWQPAETGVTGGVWVSTEFWDEPGLYWDEPGLTWDSGTHLLGAIYSGVDTSVTPGRSTNPGLRYQAFIDTIPASASPPLLAGNALPCADDGLYSGIAGSSTFDFLGAVPTGDQVVYDAINAMKVYGTLAWVAFTSPLNSGDDFSSDFPGDFC